MIKCKVYEVITEISINLGPRFSLYDGDIIYVESNFVKKVEYSFSDFYTKEKKRENIIPTKDRNISIFRNNSSYSIEDAIESNLIKDISKKYNRDLVLEDLGI